MGSLTRVKDGVYEGRTIEVCVDGAGMFRADVNGEGLKADTIKKLEQKIRDQIRRERVPVKAMQIEEDGDERTLRFLPITLTGIHAGSGRILYKDADGTSQISWSSTFHRVLDPDQQRILQGLYVAYTTAEDAYEQAKNATQINARKALGEVGDDED